MCFNHLMKLLYIKYYYVKINCTYILYYVNIYDPLKILCKYMSIASNARGDEKIIESRSIINDAVSVNLPKPCLFCKHVLLQMFYR